MINMSGGDIDEFKELGHKIETVSGDAQKLIILGILICAI